ncbi:MAG: Fic family protein [Deltaproteobacteria bacterium]|jgi:Fic family protein|nr:Fic family protein [Deltaproteobacteria bacterium]
MATESGTDSRTQNSTEPQTPGISTSPTENTMSISDLLSEIDCKRESLRKYGNQLADAQRYHDAYSRLYNTFTSNAIEGNTFSLRDTKMWLEDGITVNGKTRNELYEVDGHAKAFDYMLATAREMSIDDISRDLLVIIQDLHREFYRMIDFRFAGVYRDQQVRIVNASLLPPPPHKLLMMMDSFRSTFAELKDSLHPVILAAYAHLRLVRIHPFIDGNGRTSRLLMNLILVNRGYQIINIEPGDRSTYFNALDLAHLQETTDDNYISDNRFLSFIARLELEELKRTIELFEDVSQSPETPIPEKQP